MQTAKIILGAIIGFFSFATFIEMAGESNGAELFGAFTAFVIFGGIAGLLIYSGSKVKGIQKKEK